MLMRSQFNNLDYRRRQIDTLKVFNDNVLEIIELEEYCVHFESAGRNFIITVLLSGNFPHERPKLLISPLIQHIWVNSLTGEIEKAPGLLNYSPHSDLGRVVQAIIREFERFPPPLIVTTSNVNQQLSSNTNPNTNTNTPSQLIINQQTLITKSLDNVNNIGIMTSSPHTTPSTPNANANANANLSSYKSHEISPSSYNMQKTICNNTDKDRIITNLSTLSLEELKQLDTDPEFFDDFIEEMSVVQQLNEELDSMINQVECIARNNISKEGHLIELKRKLSDDVTTLKNLGEKCDELNKKYLKKSEEYEPQHIRELLQIAASTADTECERHVEQFLNGKIDVQTFLQNYAHSKKLSSERKAKEERLGQQLQALERASF